MRRTSCSIVNQTFVLSGGKGLPESCLRRSGSVWGVPVWEPPPPDRTRTGPGGTPCEPTNITFPHTLYALCIIFRSLSDFKKYTTYLHGVLQGSVFGIRIAEEFDNNHWHREYDDSTDYARVDLSVRYHHRSNLQLKSLSNWTLFKFYHI